MTAAKGATVTRSGRSRYEGGEDGYGQNHLDGVECPEDQPPDPEPDLQSHSRRTELQRHDQRL